MFFPQGRAYFLHFLHAKEAARGVLRFAESIAQKNLGSRRVRAAPFGFRSLFPETFLGECREVPAPGSRALERISGPAIPALAIRNIPRGSKTPIRHRCVTWRHAAQHHSAVDCAQDRCRRRARFMNAAQSSHSQRSIQGRRKSLSRDVAKIDSDHAIRQREEIQEVAAHFMKRLELLANRHISGSQRALR